MIFTPNTRSLLGKLFPFGLIWLLSGWVFLFVEVAATNSIDAQPVTAITINLPIFVFASLALVGVGVLLGFIEVRYLDNFLDNRSFGLRMVGKLLVYCLSLSLIILVLFPFAASLELDTQVWNPQVWNKFLAYWKSYTHLSTMLQLLVALALSLFYAEIQDFMGQRVLLNFFTGRYHRPVEETRIFLFADMKSSTTIAERLGHHAYFELLRAYYRCFSDAITQSGGEIYQYVGDEIILSWPMRRPNDVHRPLACFFAMQKELQQQQDWFTRHFECAPDFKAGIHLGKVTTGEIGVLKKEILFTGDAVNVTARIQSLCNTYSVKLIVSDSVHDLVTPSADTPFSFLDEAVLRGKEERIKLYTI